MEEPRSDVAKASKRGTRLRLAVAFAVTAGLLAILVHSLGGAGAFFDSVRGARGRWVLLSLAIGFACVLLSALRWRLVVLAMGYALSYGRAVGAVLAAWPLVVVTPSRTNEFLRALAIREHVPLASGAGSVLAEKAVDVFVLLALAGVGAALNGLWLASAVLGAAMLCEVAVVGMVMKSRHRLERLPGFRSRKDRVEQLFAAFEALRRAPSKLAALCTVSLAIRLLTVGVTYTMLVAVGARVELLETLTLWPVATLVGLVPVTVAGMGTRDAMFIYLLHARGALLAESSVLAATVGYSVVAIWAPAIVGLPFMLREAVFRSAARA